MCTLTWLSDADGLRVFFNRDEQRARAHAQPPTRHALRGVKVIAPVDGQSGGTWIAANEHCVVVALLNYYNMESVRPRPPQPRKSRGELIIMLADCRTNAAFYERASSADVTAYPPFILFAIDRQGEGWEMRWDGQVKSFRPLSEVPLPVTTSSFETSDVTRARRAMLDRLRDRHGGVTPAMLTAFHHSRDAQGGPYSVTMTRPDAMTVSYTAITITPDTITMTYTPRQRNGVDPGFDDAVTVAMPRIDIPNP
ncbi:MAG TPA: NRDE family protein [Kiritimatiellia bacterium]|nr:NRDE family protein [Kiritimatiellia bacterium]